MQKVTIGGHELEVLAVERGPAFLDGVQRDSLTVHVSADTVGLDEMAAAVQSAANAPEIRVSLDDGDSVHEEIFKGYTRPVSVARHAPQQFGGQVVVSAQIAKETQQEAELADIRAALAAAGIEIVHNS